MKYKAVYFDLDNTLVHRRRSIEVYAQRFATEYSAVGMGVTAGEIAEVVSYHDNGDR